MALSENRQTCIPTCSTAESYSLLSCHFMGMPMAAMVYPIFKPKNHTVGRAKRAPLGRPAKIQGNASRCTAVQPRLGATRDSPAKK